ncbi:aldehyde dehydrogenase [Amycolatopsis sp. WQ 127309]|uniref:aldehyde dehydrogenase family protein n=1 Tax=Amycolatopsis sp. WQ 127309 TaxID=2932773 RepID=UPI001FF20DA6|nr:aldehyde dehydrogenase family protein [Amycolatopsis sp. WQ 127309]UOZ03470.1 aldehyde dehydrogenase family protein [Amycolatopsis sp. WQ 127309]
MPESPKPLARRDWAAFIGGAWVTPDGAKWFDVLEPATGDTLAEVVEADEALVDLAVMDARRAYEQDWRHRTPRERGILLAKAAAVIRAHADELGELEAREVGKPRRDALRFDVSFSSAGFDYFGGLADSLHGDLLDQGPIEARVSYEPYGVVAAILPFNWPPIHFTKKSAPALAAGNTVVVKPGDQAPLTVLRLVELVNEVLPPGVVNAVTGLPAGAFLSAHPVVERITFTGATATGRKVLQSAAQNLTYATMELGGKNALLVLDDADMDVAVDISIEGMFYNQGEACTSTSRILIHRSRYDEFVEQFTEAAGRLVVGDGLDARTDIGAMVDRKQQEKVLAYIDTAVAEGAKIAFQGETPEDERLKGGYWVPPTVLVDVQPHHTVAQEELFGPVASIMVFDTDEEAVRIANGTSYGLTAALITPDHFRASRLAGELEAGMIFINNYMRRSFLGSPFGGNKGSGFGRENSAETLREFVRAKNVRFPSGRAPIPTWPPKD